MNKQVVELLIKHGDVLDAFNRSLDTFEARKWRYNWQSERVTLVRQLAKIDQASAKSLEATKKMNLKNAEMAPEVARRKTVVTFKSKTKKRRVSNVLCLMRGELLTQLTKEIIQREMTSRFEQISERAGQ